MNRIPETLCIKNPIMSNTIRETENDHLKNLYIIKE